MTIEESNSGKDPFDKVEFSEDDLDELFVDESNDDLFGDDTDDPQIDDSDDALDAKESDDPHALEGEQSPAKAEEADKDTDDQPDEKPPEGVLTKDGKHVIPYAELEAARRKAQAAESQLQELQTKLSESQSLAEKLSALERHNAILQEQLQSNELTPDQLPENLSFSEDELSAMGDYAELGGVVSKLIKQNAWMKEQIVAKQGDAVKTESSDSTDADLLAVHEAIKGNTLLSQWRDSGDERFAQAAEIDDQLRADPEWKGRTYPERFQEAVRRVQIRRGEAKTPEQLKQESDARLDEKIESSARKTPNSLSDIGSPAATEKTKLEQLAALDPNAQAAAMATMSERDLEALMADIL